MESQGSFARRVIAAAVVLAGCIAVFHAWREPTYVLTAIGALPPLAPLYAAFDPRWLPVGWVALPVLMGGVWVQQRQISRTWVFLLLAFCFAAAFRFSVHALRSDFLPGTELARYAGEAVLYDADRVVSAGDFLADYTHLQSELSLHGRTKPPGFALMYHGLYAVLGRDLERLGVWLTLAAALVVLPAYALGWQVGGRVAGRTTALLVGAAPSAVLYGALTLDALFAVVATTGLAFAMAEAATPRAWRRIALGLVLALAGMLSHSTWVLGLVVGAVLCLQSEWPWRTRVRGLFEIAAVFTAVPVVLAFSTGFDAWASFQNARGLNQIAMSAVVGRDLGGFEVWLYASVGNVLAVSTLLGLPILAGLSMLRWEQLGPGAARLSTALGLGFLVACFGGLYLLETERILLFLVPPAVALASTARGFPPLAGLVIIGLQTIGWEMAFDTIW